MDCELTRPNRDATLPAMTVLASRHFPAWLEAQGLSLACTTYQAGKMLLIGAGTEGRLAVFKRSFGRCMGLWGDGQSLWLGTGFQLWKFENVLPEGERSGNCDRLYVPRTGYTIGDVDIHDVAVNGTGRIVFVSTLFNCLATPNARYSFEVLWRPAFVSRLAAEDRCHLNGLAIVNGHPRYVTVCARTDVVNGSRDQRRDGGCLFDVDSGAAVVEGLSMPHSPRWYRGQVWLLNSGTGEFGRLDLDRGRFEPIAFCPGSAGAWPSRAIMRSSASAGPAVRPTAGWHRPGTGHSTGVRLVRPARHRLAERRRGPLDADRGHDLGTV